MPAVFAGIFVLVMSFAGGQHVHSQEGAAQPDVYEEVMALISRLKVAQAEEKIEVLLDENMHDHKAYMLRKALANALVRVRRNEEAENQFDMFLEYLLSGSEESRGLLKHIPQIMVNLKFLRQNIEPKASQTLDRAIEVLKSAVEDNPDNAAFSTGLSSAVNFKARGLHNQARFAELQELYSSELDRLRRRWRNANENPDNWLRLVYVLKAAAGPKSDSYQDFASELKIEHSNLLALGARRFPDTRGLVQEYVAVRIALIRDLEIPSPHGARSLLFELQAELDEIRKKSISPRSLVSIKSQVDKYLQKLDRRLKRQELAGTATPALAEIEWLRGDSFEWNFSEKEVTILYFFSAQNESSIAELIKLNDVLKNVTIETKLVAITHDLSQPFHKLSTIRYKRGPEFEKERQEYRRRILQDIADANNFHFPLGIALDSNRIASGFGIEQVPHLVVIDPTGLCREILTGAVEPAGFVAILTEIARIGR